MMNRFVFTLYALGAVAAGAFVAICLPRGNSIDPQPDDATRSTPVETQTELEAPTESIDPIRELADALSLEPPAKRYARYFELGYRLAQHEPEKQIDAMGDVFWDSRYYDFRGAFFAEWLRTDPKAFITWLEREHSGVSLYHVAYMEPVALLDCVPLIADSKLAESVKKQAIEYWLELDPEGLWKRRAEIADDHAIISAAADLKLWDVAIDFWQRNGFAPAQSYESLRSILAERKRVDVYLHLTDESKTHFFHSLALAHPRFAADWAMTHYYLQSTHFTSGANFTPFIESAIAHPKLLESAIAAPVAKCALELDDSETVLKTLQRIAQSRDLSREIASERMRIRLPTRDDKNFAAFQSFYLGLPDAHPLLALIEPAMTNDSDAYGELLSRRALAKSVSQETALTALEQSLPFTWPEAYREQARQALAAIPVNELPWKLSPQALCGALELADGHVFESLAQLPTEAVEAMLSNDAFFHNLRQSQAAGLEKALSLLPQDKAADIRRLAMLSMIANPRDADEFQTSLALTTEPLQYALLANPAKKLGDATWDSIATHPDQRSVLLAIASNSELETLPYIERPEMQAAYHLAASAKEYIQLSPNALTASLRAMDSVSRSALIDAVAFNLTGADNQDYLDTLIASPELTENERTRLSAFKRDSFLERYRINRPIRYR